MYELPKVIPDVDAFLALEAEELGAKILFLLKQRDHHGGNFHPGNLQGELWYNNQGQPQYPPHKRAQVDQALSEAWAWLKVQCLVVPDGGSSGSSGWCVLSRRASKYENEAQFTSYAVSRSLPIEALHPKIAKTVWMAFIRSEFDVAVFQAMKAVEVVVRKKSGLNDLLGIDLMRQAFHPKTGPLSDYTIGLAERDARSALFAGAIGSYKNPNSHRDVDLTDPKEALEIILLANHLLRIVDGCSIHRKES